VVEHGSAAPLTPVLEKCLTAGTLCFIGYSRPEIISDKLQIFLLPATAEDYARQVYALLRKADLLAPHTIVVEGIPDEGEGVAVMDRLRRAASDTIS
jgi:hypothetical protein